MTLFGLMWRAYTRAKDGRSALRSWVGVVYAMSWLVLSPFVLLFILTLLIDLQGTVAQRLAVLAFLVILFAPILPRAERT